MASSVESDRAVRIEEFLARAAQAEKFALEARDDAMKESWQKIAIAYRALAADIGNAKV